MEKKDSIRKYLLYILCSAAVIAAFVFYFHTSDEKERTTRIIIDSNECYTETASTAPPMTTTAKTTKEKARTTSTVRVKTTDTETVSEFVYLDINTANADELKKLKGIGDVLAAEIVNFRQENGSFRNIEEIMLVKGIGDSIFEDIRDHIYVVDPVYDEPDEPPEEIPEVNEPEPDPELTLEDAAPIDINTAEKDILMLLPHVDEDIADRIIEFREKSGGFSNGYELLLIEGLSRSKVEEILEYITV